MQSRSNSKSHRFAVVAAILACLAILPGLAVAQTDRAPISGFAQLSGWTDDHFSSIGGTFSVGAQTLLDADRAAFLRIGYKRVNIGPEPLHSVDIGAIEYWDIGGKWSAYVNPGVSIGVISPAETDLFFAFGAEKELFRANNPAYRLPFTALAYADIGFFKYATQLTIGFRFTKPQK